MNDDERKKQLENILQDRFKDYLVVATDGTDIFFFCSSMATAYGLSQYIQVKIKDKWEDLEEEDETET